MLVTPKFNNLRVAHTQSNSHDLTSMPLLNSFFKNPLDEERKEEQKKKKKIGRASCGESVLGIG